MEKAERAAVLKGAEDAGVVTDSPAHALLQSWLQRKPSADLFKAWKDFIHATRPVMSDVAFRELHAATAQRAYDIAEAAGGFLGLNKVSKAEAAAIAELDAVFQAADSAVS